MYKMMENLINNKYYATKEEVENKLNVFFAFNVITAEQYAILMALAESKYGVPVVVEEELPVKEEPSVDPETMLL